MPVGRVNSQDTADTVRLGSQMWGFTPFLLVLAVKPGLPMDKSYFAYNQGHAVLLPMCSGTLFRPSATYASLPMYS